MRILLFSCIMLLTSPSVFGNDTRGFTQQETAVLVEALKDQGLSQKQLRSVFSHKSVQKMPSMVKLNVTQPIKLKAANYAHFAQEPALERARKFLRLWRTTFHQAEQRYQIPKEVMVAILLIETNLGKFTGKNHLISIYSSIFVESDQLSSQPKIKADPKMAARVKRKKRWSLRQLEALIAMKVKKSANILKLRGSYAGAIGLPQFLPSSYMSYAVTAKGGTPDLYFTPDAIHSVANYLKGHGYNPEIPILENRKPIFAYNNSDVYVDIVLKVANRLTNSG